MKQLTITVILIYFFSTALSAQKIVPNTAFSIRLEPLEIKGFPALQSFAYASWQGKWLLLGGRKDGLHRRQPFATFDEEGQNQFIYVADPLQKKVWKQSIQKLPAMIREQLQSTNMEFHQTEGKLLLAGGYGFSKTADDHVTFPYLTVVDLEAAINAIIKQQPVGKAFVQIKDERMALTGGRMGKMQDTLLLAGGQRFDGAYNPMGPDKGPGFSQIYANEIRKFTVDFSNAVPVINNYNVIRDTINLHRRDYNLVPQIFPNGSFGYTMFSGVFQYNVDLPYTNSVDINEGGYTVDSFQQRLSHYHSSVMPVYDKTTATMFSIFLGGIAEYYPNAKGVIMENKDVPFTKTISVMTRNKERAAETYFSTTMPGYLGAAAEFIFNPAMPQYAPGVGDIATLQNNETLVGYVVGGINSSDKNIFWTSEGEQSSASSKVIKVYLKKL